MSFYTTGELAKRCHVSVRTVQYYDQRGILVPTELSEGGRRLFSEEDVKTLETICFLRELDISIKDIGEILTSGESEKVIELLLDQRAEELEKDIRKKTGQLEKIRNIRRALAACPAVSQKAIHDISAVMGEKEQLKKLYRKLILIAVPLEAAEVATLVLGILKGIWIPFAAVMAVMALCVWVMFHYWYHRVGYICPECHTEFKPRKREAFLGNHTPRTRRLTCPCCQRKIWCLEMYRQEETE